MLALSCAGSLSFAYSPFGSPGIVHRSLSSDGKMNLIIGVLSIAVTILGTMLAWAMLRLTQDRRRRVHQFTSTLMLLPSIPCLLLPLCGLGPSPVLDLALVFVLWHEMTVVPPTLNGSDSCSLKVR